MGEERSRFQADGVEKLIAGVVLASGCLVLGGWVFDVKSFKTGVPGFPPMSASTAICFVLTSITLLFASSGEGRQVRRLAGVGGKAAMVIVMGIALCRFLEYVFDWEPDTRGELFGLVARVMGNSLGSMALNTALGFLLTGAGVLSLLRRAKEPNQQTLLVILGITTCSLAMAILVCYATGFRFGEGAPGMALHTAALFLLLGLALVARAWEMSGQAWLLSRRLTAAFFVAGGIILSLNVIGYRLSNQQADENFQLAHELARVSKSVGSQDVFRVHHYPPRALTAENRHNLFAGILAGLALFAGVLWELNREAAERQNAERALREIELTAARALKESDERFRQMAENIESVFWMSNADLTEFAYVSPACERVWGRTQASLCAQGDSFIAAVHSEDRERVSAQLRQKHFIQKAGFELEYRIVRSDGSVRWVRHRAFPIKGEEGELRRLVGIAEDISDRKEAESAARISQEFFRSVWERSADGMRLTDKDGRIIAVNEAYCHIVKLPREKLEGQSFSVAYFCHGPTDGIETYVRRFQSGDIVARLAARVQLWNSEQLELEISNSFLELGDKGRTLLSIFRDVSERRGLEEQLRQSQKMEAVGRLAGGVAHDFNNLLVVMRTHAELMLLDGVERPAEERDGLKQITKAADRAANLTRQLLAFSRKQVMQTQPLALNDIVANLTKMLNRIIGEDVHLECRYAGGLPAIQADAGMLEQLILNLVVNARDAMPEGGQLQVGTEKIVLDESWQRTSPEGRPGEFVCLKVTDTGTGIAPEHLPRIFEPFFTTKELGKGTGLGLATVYGIVKQHQGWIDVTSRPGAGTTFKVFFPSLAGMPASPVPEPNQPPVRGGSETILLVEDDLSVRMAIKQSLELHGYKIYEATCAREALDSWQQHGSEIDLLLTDIVMPEGVNGRELAERIRVNKPGLGVIFMSGYSAEMAGRDTSFFRRNRTAFLQKPFPAPVLLEAVRRCVEEEREVMSC
jgi:PAS domain S-box-containing protein